LERLPQSLLNRADGVERRPDGTVSRRTWRRRTLWRYADIAFATGTTTIDGRPALDRTGIVTHAGVDIHTVDVWIRDRQSDGPDRPGNGFPAAVEDRWYYLDDIDAWCASRQTDRQDALTRVDRSGDPDELVTRTEAARILGYSHSWHLGNSPVYAALIERNNSEHNVPLPGGGTRLRWPRHVVWDVGASRTNRRGRPVGASAATRTVDCGGDPDELVGASEAARVLGYRHPSGLPRKVLDRADVPLSPGQPRRWRRRTLWEIASQAAARNKHSEPHPGAELSP
jgi:hypothetical protein